MAIRLVFFLVLLSNFLVVGAAIVIYKNTGVNHFGEGGFITILSVLQLLVISSLSCNIFRIRKAANQQSLWKDSSAVWAIIALGFIFLAADDFFMIHETVDRLIHHVFNIQETGFTDRIDDVLVGLYGLAGVAVLMTYHKELKNFREAFPFFIIGFVFLFTMVLFDVLTNRKDILSVFFGHDYASIIYVWLFLAEDSLKVFAEAFFIIAFFLILKKSKYMEDGAVIRTGS